MTGFGRFQGRILELEPGLNVIVGPNEAGKTTVQKFILGMLYGFKKRAQRRDFTADVARYRPWQGGEYRGALVYSLAGGKSFRVEREFDPYRDDVHIYDDVVGTDLTERFPRDRRKELLFAEEQLKLSEDVFRSTAWVGQLQVGNLELGKELLTRLANMQESGRDDLSVKDSIGILEERMRQIGSERAPTRPYSRVARLLEEKLQELERALAAWEHVRRWEARLADARASLSQIQEEQAEVQRQLDWMLWRESAVRLERVEQASRRLGELRRETEQLSRYADFPVYQRDRLLRSQAEAEEAARRSSEMGGAELPTLEAEIERLRVNMGEMDQLVNPLVAAAEHGDEITTGVEALEARITELRQHVERGDAAHIRELVASLRRQRRSGNTMVGLWVVLAALFGAAAAYLLMGVGTFAGNVAMGLGGGVAVFALIFLALTGVSFAKSRQANRRLEEMKVQLEQAMATADAARRQLPELEEERRKLLRSVGVGSVGDVHRAATRYQQMIGLREKQQSRLELMESRAAALRVETDRAGRARAEVDALLAEAGVDSIDQFETACTLAEAWTAADREARTMQETLNALLGIDTLSKLDLEVGRLGARLEGDEPRESLSSTALQEEIRRLQSQRVDLNALTGDLSARVETGQHHLPDAADLAQEIDSLKAQKATFDEELAALDLAKSVMADAAEEIHRDFAPKLNAAMGQAVSELTGGRYRAVKVDESLSIRAVAGGDRTVDLLSLSSGTIDQFYLGLRLSLLELIQGAEPVPLMLDDPFVQYDDVRVGTAMSHLGNISQKHQVIFMTCHDREVRIAQELGLKAHVIYLARDEALEATR